jgi:hypothetical protein
MKEKVGEEVAIYESVTSASVACHSLESFRPDINPCPSQPGLSPKHRLAVYLESLLRNKLVNRGELATGKLVSQGKLSCKRRPEANKPMQKKSGDASPPTANLMLPRRSSLAKPRTVRKIAPPV